MLVWGYYQLLVMTQYTQTMKKKRAQAHIPIAAHEHKIGMSQSTTPESEERTPLQPRCTGPFMSLPHHKVPILGPHVVQLSLHSPIKQSWAHSEPVQTRVKGVLHSLDLGLPFLQNR